MPSPPEWKSDGFFVLIKVRDMTTGDWSWRRAEPAEFSEILDAAVAAEREACAKIADEWSRTAFGLGADAVRSASANIAEAIRNRVR